MKKGIKRVIASLILLFLPEASFAAPTITNVSGTLTHGSTVTVSGSGFGTKVPAAPYIWADFNGGDAQPSVLGRVSSWTVVNFTPTAGVGVRGTVGLQSYTWNGQEQNFGALVGNTPSGFGWNDYGRKLYIFRKGKRDWDITDAMNWKNLRIWYGTGSLYTAINNGNISEEVLPNAGYMCAWQSPLSSECPDGITIEETRGYGDGRWNTEQYTLKNASGPGAPDGFLEYIVNGKKAAGIPYFDYAQKYFAMGAGTPREAWYVHDESANDPDPPLGAHTWSDDVYVDDTWARVMLSDRATWGTDQSGPRYEIQIPTSWNATSILISVNQGELPEGPAYLYVVDSTGAVNATGYPVTVGGTPDTTPPAAPSGLSVQ